MAAAKKLKNGFYSLRVADFKDISKTHVFYALRNLGKVKKLLASEENWLKQEYEDVSDNGQLQYCLIGAKREADGTGENTAYVIMLAALGVHVRFAFELDDIDAYEAKGFITVEDDEQDTTVQSFNDEDVTDFKTIHKFLDYCISFANRLYQHKHQRA